MRVQKTEPTVVDVKAEPVKQVKKTKPISPVPAEGGTEVVYMLNKSSACMRRVMKMKLSDKQVTKMLKDPKERRQFGYMYLVQMVADE